MVGPTKYRNSRACDKKVGFFLLIMTSMKSSGKGRKQKHEAKSRTKPRFICQLAWLWILYLFLVSCTQLLICRCVGRSVRSSLTFLFSSVVSHHSPCQIVLKNFIVRFKYIVSHGLATLFKPGFVRPSVCASIGWLVRRCVCVSICVGVSAGESDRERVGGSIPLPTHPRRYCNTVLLVQQDNHGRYVPRIYVIIAHKNPMETSKV